MQEVLKRVVGEFKIASEFESYQELNFGHINDTFLIKTKEKPFYILQRINGKVFPKTEELITNKILVSKHLQKKFKDLGVKEIAQKVVCFVEAKDTTFFYKDEDANFWNLSIYIEDSITHLKAPSAQIALEAGKITGQFLALTKDFDVTQLQTILEDFHSVTKRYQQFKNALVKTSEKKRKKVKDLIEFIESHIEAMLQIDMAIAENKIPVRLTHSDTKISNILFNQKEKAICLIDLDTVMQGVIHFDYADAIRTICNTANEDTTQLEEIDFNFDFFTNYTKGFLKECKNLSKNELELLPISIKIVPFLMGMRFITDWLNDNIYFKINYQNHNLDRAINQFTYIKKINQNYKAIKAFIKANVNN